MKNKPINRNFFVNFEQIREENGEKSTKYGIIGRPIVYNEPTVIGGCYREIIRETALNECDLKDVLLCYNHDMTKIPLARSRRNNGKSTMTLTLDAQGLMIEAELDVENNQEARAVYSSIERGDLNGMSFRMLIDEYKVIEPTQEGELPTIEITKIKQIREVSVVNCPAYAQTSVETSRDEVNPDEAMEILEKIRQEETIEEPVEEVVETTEPEEVVEETDEEVVETTEVVENQEETGENQEEDIELVRMKTKILLEL